MVLYRRTSVINYVLQFLVQCSQQVRHKLGMRVYIKKPHTHTFVRYIQSNTARWLFVKIISLLTKPMFLYILLNSSQRNGDVR